MATEVLPTIVALGTLGAIVWKAAQLKADIQLSIKEASLSSGKAIAEAANLNKDEIERAIELTQIGQQEIKTKFELQFNSLQKQNADRYRQLNEGVQLHLRDFKHEVEIRQRSEELFNKELEALKTEFYKALAEREKIIESLQKQIKDIVGYLEKNGFVNRDR